MDQPAQPYCNRCTHYFITHDVNFRYGCRAFGFKSCRQPVLEVMEASWRECLHFLPKQASAGRSGAGG